MTIQQADSFDVETLISQFAKLESRRDELASAMAARKAINMALLEEQFAALDTSLFGRFSAAPRPVPASAAVGGPASTAPPAGSSRSGGDSRQW